jgi:hypothetical protein
MHEVKKWGLAILLAVLITVSSFSSAFAVSSASSPNYKVTEMQLGAGSALLNCSDQYCSHPIIGDGSDGTSSTSTAGSSLQFDPLSTAEPLLEVIVESGESNLGVLTTDKTATKTTVVKVRNYLSGGYIMQVAGSAPKYAGHSLSTPSTPIASMPGTEQFAMNIVANTTPAVGANPVQVPSNGTSFGFAEPGYDTPNLFKYVNGDVIGRSLSETGETDYTISMIINVSSGTPSGRYYGDFSVVVAPVY